MTMRDSAMFRAMQQLDREDSETVHTWADGFGRWHARVSFPGQGYGQAHLAANIGRIRAKARRAIRAEIVAREATTSDPKGREIAPIRIKVEENDLDHMNVMRSITFGERWAD